MFFSFFDEIFAHKFVRLRFCFVLNPLFICLIGSDFAEAYDTWHLVFVEGFYRGFHDFPVLDAGLVDGCNFFTFGEYAFPPEDTLHRIVVHTGNKTLMEEFSTHSDGFWLGWMGDVDEEEGHRIKDYEDSQQNIRNILLDCSSNLFLIFLSSVTSLQLAEINSFNEYICIPVFQFPKGIINHFPESIQLL